MKNTYPLNWKLIINSFYNVISVSFLRLVRRYCCWITKWKLLWCFVLIKHESRFAFIQFFITQYRIVYTFSPISWEKQILRQYTDMRFKRHPKALNWMQLLKSLPNARREWNLKTPLDKYFYLYSFGRAPAGAIELQVFEDVDVHWFSFFYFVYSGTLTALVLFTFYDWFLRGEISKALPCSCMWCIGCLAVRITFVI